MFSPLPGPCQLPASPQPFKMESLDLYIRNSNWSPLHSVSFEDDVNLLTLMLQKCEANPNCRTINGLTPLHIAISSGSTRVFEMLLNDARVDLEAVDSDGWSALKYAYADGNGFMIRKLIAAGASTNHN